MFIQVEQTPNPETLKFLPGRVVMEEGTATYSNMVACEDSPLAKRLLGVEGVTAVFFGHDFITLTKTPEAEWYLLKPLVLGIFLEHFVANLPVIISSPKPQVMPGDEDPLTHQIRELLDTRIRPAVAQDGGDITFHAFKDGIVYLQMRGACSGCPSSQATLKNGIENLLRYYVPEVTEVQAVNA